VRVGIFLSVVLALCLVRQAMGFECEFLKQDSSLLLRLKLSQSDMEPLFRSIERGLSITLFSEVNVGKQRSYFGCKVHHSLWDENYAIEDIVSRSRRTQVAFKDLPKECVEFSTKDFNKSVADVAVNTVLNPISDRQQEITRSWLASRGVGSGSSQFFGRALYAFIDLKADRSMQADCKKVPQ
jgi:hypothetical protein